MLGTEVPKHHQEKLMQTLIVCLLKNACFHWSKYWAPTLGHLSPSPLFKMAMFHEPADIRIDEKSLTCLTWKYRLGENMHINLK